MRPSTAAAAFRVLAAAGLLLPAAALTSFALAPAARADIAGSLLCNVAGGTGAVIAASRAVSCTFRSAGAPDEFYNGTVSRLGLDIGTLQGGTLSYQVLALGAGGPGALQGSYVGSGVGVTLGRGIGAEALIGGSGNAVTLQPLATTTGSGANISAGLGALRLQYAGIAPAPYARHRRHAY